MPPFPILLILVYNFIAEVDDDFQSLCNTDFYSLK